MFKVTTISTSNNSIASRIRLLAMVIKATINLSSSSSNISNKTHSNQTETSSQLHHTRMRFLMMVAINTRTPLVTESKLARADTWRTVEASSKLKSPREATLTQVRNIFKETFVAISIHLSWIRGILKEILFIPIFISQLPTANWLKFVTSLMKTDSELKATICQRLHQWYLLLIEIPRNHSNHSIIYYLTAKRDRRVSEIDCQNPASSSYSCSSQLPQQPVQPAVQSTS